MIFITVVRVEEKKQKKAMNVSWMILCVKRERGVLCVPNTNET